MPTSESFSYPDEDELLPDIYPFQVDFEDAEGNDNATALMKDTGFMEFPTTTATTATIFDLPPYTSDDSPQSNQAIFAADKPNPNLHSHRGAMQIDTSPGEWLEDIGGTEDTFICTSAMNDEMRMRRALERAAGKPHINELNSPVDGIEDEENKPQNGGEVRICPGCITRERKRAGRKKIKKPEEEELWDRYERERAIVFNTQEVKEWQTVTPLMADPTGAGFINGALPEGTVQVDAPMRIACYCRHHGEKAGRPHMLALRRRRRRNYLNLKFNLNVRLNLLLVMGYHYRHSRPFLRRLPPIRS
ncbi:hypothetical protein ONZ43_g633 [Nemania bipapillata]|uniref:Uncharacterized protein n=1 Tax=Nemania bipapillata TaxID=110536 RepID=A0ACC2J7N5_9PEZI|nr:hypothetical protein ONZ43_g633 [Nemania bipapillata]